LILNLPSKSFKVRFLIYFISRKKVSFIYSNATRQKLANIFSVLVPISVPFMSVFIATRIFIKLKKMGELIIDKLFGFL